MRRLNPTVLAALALGFILVLLIATIVLQGRNSGNEDRLADAGAAAEESDEPAERCGSQRTYEALKTELFRQASALRGRDQNAFDRLAAFAVVRMANPVMRSHDRELGLIRCSGRLSLDLPPGVAVVGGRRSLTTDLEYVVQSAADRTGDVIMMDGADNVIVPLATLARSGAAPTAPPPEVPGNEVPAPLDVQPVPGTPIDGPAPEPVPDRPAASPPPATASPSFNCRNARTRGEIAVCSDAGLAQLDRRMAGEFNQAMSAASPAQRALLQRTRNAFLGYRDRCPNDSCIAETYRGRIREIRDIMADRWTPER